MPAKIALTHRVESEVGTISEFETNPITIGKRATVKYFGAAIPGTGIVDLHFGTAGNWQFLRSIASTTYEFSNINEDFVGDGIKKFKITRTRQGGGGPLAIKTWFKAIET
jgi:hypothetical protein